MYTWVSTVKRVYCICLCLLFDPCVFVCCQTLFGVDCQSKSTPTFNFACFLNVPLTWFHEADTINENSTEESSKIENSLNIFLQNNNSCCQKYSAKHDVIKNYSCCTKSCKICCTFQKVVLSFCCIPQKGQQNSFHHQKSKPKCKHANYELCCFVLFPRPKATTSFCSVHCNHQKTKERGYLTGHLSRKFAA